MAEVTRLAAGEIASAVGGALLTDGARTTEPVSGFSIDSRTLAPGELFFAIRGQRFDGHDFAVAALQAGACGVVVSKAPVAPLAGPGRRAPLVIRVEDTTQALQRLGHYVRRRSGARVVAITGSVGKTTTKEVTAEFLADRFVVFRNEGNLNNHIGLPLSLLELRSRPDVAVVELGMSHAGEIRTLVRIADPEARVWTNVAEVHSEFFASLEAIADAKAEILEEAGTTTLLVANADDPLVMARAKRFRGRVMTFGFAPSADVRARDVRDLGLSGTASMIETPSRSATLTVPLMGRGNLANVLAAASVALSFGVPLASMVERAATLRPAPRRGEVIRLPNEIRLVDDSYNANPLAVAGILEVVRQERQAGRRVAFLGEMLELGERSFELHEGTGRLAAFLDLLVTMGGEPARRLGEAAIAAGMRRDAVIHFEKSEEAADAALSLVRPGDLVLVKGSRGIKTDRVVDRLKAEPA